MRDFDWDDARPDPSDLAEEDYHDRIENERIMRERQRQTQARADQGEPR